TSTGTPHVVRRWVPIRVRWLSPEEGGRPVPFTGSRYANPARVVENGEPIKIGDSDWTLDVRFEAAAAARGNPEFGCASWLVEGAPVERLVRGCLLAIFEGKQWTATAEVLEGRCVPEEEGG